MAESKTQALYEHAKQRIPGGTQLLSKRPEMFAPEQWPAYFRKAQGCEVWDLDDRHYFDMSHNGVGTCLLGYAHPEVSSAVKQRIDNGSMCSLNPPEEVELADTLCELHPWADQTRFTRSGGEACAVAVRIARATTGRSKIAICGYHGWHDWYLAANLQSDHSLGGHLLPGLAPNGVPQALQGTALTFAYNDRHAFEKILHEHGDELAAVIMEPCRYNDPDPGFLEYIREATRKSSALLIFDEITIGWRRCYGGAHLQLGIQPDIAVFAKALGNGHPIGAVIGTAAAMDGAQESFISSTYWTESVGPVAALATLNVMRATDVCAHVDAVGTKVQALWRTLGAEHRLPLAVPESYPCLAHFAFDHDDAPMLKTLYTQEMLKHGFLAGTAIYPTLAHTDEIVDAYGEAIGKVFMEISKALQSDTLQQRIEGPVAHEGFRRLV